MHLIKNGHQIAMPAVLKIDWQVLEIPTLWGGNSGLARRVKNFFVISPFAMVGRFHSILK